MTVLLKRDWGKDRRWRYYWRALRDEWRRILAWRRRINPANGKRFGTLDAWRSVIENNPSLDHMWDDTFDGSAMEDCQKCFGEGEIVTCIDDLCANTRHMHPR